MPPHFGALRTLFLLGGLLAASAAWAAAPSAGDAGVRRELVKALESDGAARQELLNKLADSGSKVVNEVLTAWSREEIYWYQPPSGGKVPVLVEDQQDAAGKVRAVRIDTGGYVVDSRGGELRFDVNAMNSVDTDMRLRSAIRQTLDVLTLADPDPDARQSAVVKLGNSQKLSYVPVLEARLGKESNPDVKRAIRESIAMLKLGSADSAVQSSAAGELARLDAVGSVDALKRLAASSGAKPDVAAAAQKAIVAIGRHIATVEFYGTIFRGISLGSILLIVALGLAITFGLMGIINMAHGEMIAVGAYTCYVVQNVFGAGFSFAITLPFSFLGKQLGFGLRLPGINAGGWLYESYFLFALPLSFLMAALAGIALERTVIRFLYRRPLESLLATWGVSLVLQQCFRMIFGANNVQVDSPPAGCSATLASTTLSMGYNRVFVIGFAIFIVLGTWLLLTRTPLGLLIRSVMQNREMAACMGGAHPSRQYADLCVRLRASPGWPGHSFPRSAMSALPWAQNYIVDSFMTVVVGGVGSIVGTVCAALGIGTVDQVLQQLLDSPVVGKITVLILIILFLQRKPGGLFSVRTRSLD